MASQKSVRVTEAFNLLLKELEAEINIQNQVGGQAFTRGNYTGAQRVLRDVEALQEIRDGLTRLQGKWQSINFHHGQEAATRPQPPPQEKPSAATPASSAPVLFDRKTEALVRSNPALRDLLVDLYRTVLVEVPNAVFYGTTKWMNFKCEHNFLVLSAVTDHFDVGIAVGADYQHPRLNPRRSRGGVAGWNGWGPQFQGLRIRSTADLDEQFRQFVRIAADMYGGCQG